MPQRTTDLAVGTAAASLPVWALSMQEWAIWFTAVGGGCLVAVRIAMSAWEWRQKMKRVAE